MGKQTTVTNAWDESTKLGLINWPSADRFKVDIGSYSEELQ